MTDICAIGEILIDLTQTDCVNGIRQYAAYPGGAPANVSVAAARLGASTAFIGKIGQDTFGQDLRQVLRDNGVDDAGLYESDQAPTTLAVVSVDEQGERSFTFYRGGGADTLLTHEEANAILKEPPRFLHMGSVSLSTEPSRSAVLTTARRAKAMGSLVSYDPNYRPGLWCDHMTALHWMKEPLEFVDVLKVSREELPLLADCDGVEKGSRKLAALGVSLVLVTLGSQGVFYRMGEHTGRVPGVEVAVADTNGAGDTFFGAVLSRLARRGSAPLEGLTPAELEDILAFANRAAALTCSRPGAIPAMPTLEELEG